NNFKRVKRMLDLFFPVAVETCEYHWNGTTIYYPQMVKHSELHIEQKVNRQIEKTVMQLIEAQKVQQHIQTFDQMIGLYEIKTNERNVLSLTLTNYAIHAHAAHGLTLKVAMNFDLKTGENWDLSKQFIPDSDFLSKLTKLVNQQIEMRDFPVFNEPVMVHSDQDYYIADKALVLFYQIYDISPYYVGLPMFPISVYEIEDILTDDSLLS